MTLKHADTWNLNTPLAGPFYLMDEFGDPIQGAPRFPNEDAAYDYVEETYGIDAWNDTVILASEEVAS